ncbi:PREDICTED: cytosolic sulfotransferase 5-like [Erythranthe guttata]|nr:PREDICTED: cytosolic sulfotransferase 5-like [Erythranthe guttata]|eukprot:XP_012847838.1 PREDICTED: cytosolic sulfotransferase 5-like [Erythranthe guttata]
MVEYWAKSKKRPDKILFVKYEELKTEPKRHVSKIAEFLGRPYVNGDEGELVEEVLSRCCVERLKNLEVNKNGSVLLNVPNSSFFRKGEVGGWKNYLTAKMEEMIDQTSCIKLEPFGLFL